MWYQGLEAENQTEIKTSIKNDPIYTYNAAQNLALNFDVPEEAAKQFLHYWFPQGKNLEDMEVIKFSRFPLA